MQPWIEVQSTYMPPASAAKAKAKLAAYSAPTTLSGQSAAASRHSRFSTFPGQDAGVLACHCEGEIGKGPLNEGCGWRRGIVPKCQWDGIENPGWRRWWNVRIFCSCLFFEMHRRCCGRLGSFWLQQGEHGVNKIWSEYARTQCSCFSCAYFSGLLVRWWYVVNSQEVAGAYKSQSIYIARSSRCYPPTYNKPQPILGPKRIVQSATRKNDLPQDPLYFTYYDDCESHSECRAETGWSCHIAWIYPLASYRHHQDDECPF